MIKFRYVEECDGCHTHVPIRDIRLEAEGFLCPRCVAGKTSLWHAFKVQAGKLLFPQLQLQEA